jgi:hypothetical protein
LSLTSDATCPSCDYFDLILQNVQYFVSVVRVQAAGLTVGGTGGR